MTATTVDGRAVLKVEPLISNIKRRDGSRIPYARMGTLHLDDGSTVVGCLVDGCSFTHQGIGGVRHHVRSHNSDNGRPLAEWTIGELMALHTSNAGLLKALKAMTDDRNAERRLRRAAERELATLRNTAAGLLGRLAAPKGRLTGLDLPLKLDEARPNVGDHVEHRDARLPAPSQPWAPPAEDWGA